MDEGAIDREAMGRIAKALAFIKGATDPTALAMKLACESGQRKGYQSRPHPFPATEARRTTGRAGHAVGRLTALPARID